MLPPRLIWIFKAFLA